MTNELRSAYLMAVSMIVSIIVMALLLHQPLAWLHDANGTFPALQTPINAFVTIVAGAGVAALAWTLLDRWRSYRAETQRSTRPSRKTMLGLTKPEVRSELG